MKASDKGIGFIKKHEGLKLDAYKCPAGVWTVGYGHTGPEVVEGYSINQAQADKYLSEDVSKFEETVNGLKVPLQQHQFDALVAFSYNVGDKAAAESTLAKHLTKGQFDLAANEFPRWNKSKGKVLPGLVTRRAEERDMFLGKNVAGYEASTTSPTETPKADPTTTVDYGTDNLDDLVAIVNKDIASRGVNPVQQLFGVKP
jgi:lysozyme